MNITNLRLLADAASKRDATQIDLNRYYYATSSATILHLLDLLDEMAGALEKYQNRGSMDDLENAGYAGEDALAKYKEWMK